jgi:putative phosphoesterase
MSLVAAKAERKILMTDTRIRTYGLLSDTHGRLHPEVFRLFEGVEMVLHAGDVGDESILVELETIAPVSAVSGNVDLTGEHLPPLRVLELPFGCLLLTHSHLQDAAGRDPESLARHFASRNPRVIVFGHSHRAYAAHHNGVLLVNPGPAGKPRFRDKPSVALLSWDPGKDSLSVRHIPLQWTRA